MLLLSFSFQAKPPLIYRRKDENRLLKFVNGKPLYRRTLQVSRLESFNCRKLFSRTSAAAFTNERRGLNFHRFNFTYSSAAAFIPVTLSAAALIFSNFSFMSAAALIKSVPSAAAFKRLSASFRPTSSILHFSHLLFYSIFLKPTKLNNH